VATPETADRVVREIVDRAARLESLPAPGRAREDLRPGLRSLLAQPDTIFFRIKDDEVEIVRVLRERPNFHAALAEDDP
jgi:toxin ParE1/3/4